MRIAREGFREIAVATLILGALTAGGLSLFWPAAIPSFIVWLWVITFFRDVNLELKRVTWPNKEQIISATAVVIIATLIVSAYLGAVDALLAKILHFLLK